MKEQMAVFKRNLEQFALKYKKDIRQDPLFRAQFHQMCMSIGVDPLASNKGVWTSLLGFGDFYYELGVQVVEACLASKQFNGGMMEVSALRRAVNARRGSQVDPVSEDDIIRAAQSLRVLGEGFRIVTVGKRQFALCVPGELNTDTSRIIDMAQERGFTGVKEVMLNLGWSREYSLDTLQYLLKQGLAMVDSGDPIAGEDLYWFPCVAAPGTFII
eukprot:CAMPEP_0175048004 /NCGR_PEP_ID=MMETSP0052_2-20121109/5925_1 /TAXON_ID=51329 ORGANISM="Polytomella parva, Strain SAG 63-3" /NCGR_SAMPLE_ID=MMETSP0052_2 /ASSEMBLY_ACC=CAM_ASM_000194 /LENGTH=214 /DNA_ID=CAMNT_0016311973 /DNA_START=152 /DNA_END=796 /DNA_ORIENTATION=-